MLLLLIMSSKLRCGWIWMPSFSVRQLCGREPGIGFFLQSTAQCGRFFLVRDHAKLQPVDFSCRRDLPLRHGPQPEINHRKYRPALAATSRATPYLSSTDQTIGGVVAQVVRPDSCAACSSIIRRCPYRCSSNRPGDLGN